MSVVWIAEKFKKAIKEKKEDTQTQILNGCKSFDDYQYLRGRYNSLVDVEEEFRELLERIVKNDDEEQSNST